ncbi:MAG: hypothetical protein Q4D96_11150 [Propionibacteriaceae bacterium]|nr:hypothetical protein [Propionibacteriaceae bacterium]
MTINIPRAVAHADDAAALVAQLKALSNDERAEWTATMKKSLPVWRQVMQWWMIDRDDITKTSDPTRRKILNHAVDAFDRHHRTTGRLLLVAVALGATPAQFVKLCHPEGLTKLEHEEAIEHLTDLMIERGTEWAEETMTGLLARPTTAAAASSLISRLVIQLDLPVPHVAAHLGVWFGTLPAPGTRWQDHFLAACATHDVFWQSPERDKHIARIREAATALRLTEPTDDAALLDGLLSVIERGERPGPQREALAWIEGLDLDLSTQPARLLRALDLADSRVVAAFSAALLAMPLDDDALTQLALAVLPRKEKGLKRDVLKRLDQLTTPSAELTELVTELSRDTDTTTAKLASTLCESWGSAPAQDAQTQGLWQEPSRSHPEPFPGLEPLVLDDPALTALLEEVDEDWDERTELTERALAQLVATTHARGPEVVAAPDSQDDEPVDAACEGFDMDDSLPPYLQQLLGWLGDGTLTPGTPPPDIEPDGGPLLYLAAERARAVCHGLGQLPCLLSTPSDSRFRVSVDDLRSRTARYIEAGVPLEPTDVAVALGRCEPAEIVDLAGFDAPIRGCNLTLAEVIDTWRSAEPGPAWLQSEAENPQWGCNLVVDGEDPFWHELLGLDTAWNQPYRPGWFPPDQWRPSSQWGAAVADGGFGSRTEFPSVFTLLPGLPSRPAATVLQLLTNSQTSAALDRFLDLAATARRFPELLAVAALATATTVAAKDRDKVAEVLLAAWDEGRLVGDDLVAGWRSPAWDVLADDEAGKPIDRAPAKLAPVLKSLAEAGGLALVWPLLTEIAEELAAADKVPATAGTVFETILALLPEVPHPVELPNITALAARKGSSKAITLARTIAEKVVSR